MFERHLPNRRELLRGLGLGACNLMLAGCGTDKIITTKMLEELSVKELFEIYIKILGTLETEDVYVWFKGVLWGALPGRQPAPFCGFQGLARHRWIVMSDGRFSQTAYDVGFFSDIETGAPIETLTNPLTQETVRPYHNKYGGFEQVHSLETFTHINGDGKSDFNTLDWRIAGNQLSMTEISGGQVKTKLAPETWPRETSGLTNFYAGETSYTAALKDVLSPDVKRINYNLFWSSFSPWEPWLLMDGAPGVCQWRATGMKLSSYKDAPKQVLSFVEKDQPNYFDADNPWEGYRSAVDSFMKDRKPASQ